MIDWFKTYLLDLLLEDINKPFTNSLVHLDILKIGNSTSDLVLKVLVLKRVQAENEAWNFWFSVDYLTNKTLYFGTQQLPSSAPWYWETVLPQSHPLWISCDAHCLTAPSSHLTGGCKYVAQLCITTALSYLSCRLHGQAPTITIQLSVTTTLERGLVRMLILSILLT